MATSRQMRHGGPAGPGEDMGCEVAALAPWLRARALRHLARYACPRARLEALLVRWGCRRLGWAEPDAALVALARAIADEMVTAGYVDDRTWATARARRWLARGIPPRHIRRRLQAEGLDDAHVAAALAALADEPAAAADELEAAELAAARAYVRRRRLGPWRPAAERAAWRARDLAALARAGFTYRVARQVLDEEVPA